MAAMVYPPLDVGELKEHVAAFEAHLRQVVAGDRSLDRPSPLSESLNPCPCLQLGHLFQPSPSLGDGSASEETHARGGGGGREGRLLLHTPCSLQLLVLTPDRKSAPQRLPPLQNKEGPN
jgi:hypothetical protein